MQGLRFAIVVLVSIWSLLGSGEFARASDLKLNFVNSNTKAPYFPITEMKVSQTKIGGKVASQVKFEYTDKIGEKKEVKILLHKKGWIIETCPSFSGKRTRHDREAREQVQIKDRICEKEAINFTRSSGSLFHNMTAAFPPDGSSAIHLTFEAPDPSDKENGGRPNLVISRAGLKIDEDGRTFEVFERDPTLRLRFSTKGGFRPSQLLRTTRVMEPISGDAEVTTKMLRRSTVRDDGVIDWTSRTGQPMNSLKVEDSSYPSSKWPVRKDGSIEPPKDLITPEHPNWQKMDANDQRALQPPASSAPPAAPPAQ